MNIVSNYFYESHSKELSKYIKNDSELMKLINEINDADIEDGGSGAFYIFLKKN